MPSSSTFISLAAGESEAFANCVNATNMLEDLLVGHLEIEFDKLCWTSSRLEESGCSQALLR